MNRKRKKPGPKPGRKESTVQVGFRVTAATHRAMTKKANADGHLGVSSWIRSVIAELL